MALVKTQARAVKLTRTCSLGACPDDRRIAEIPSSPSAENQSNQTKTKFYTDWITRLVRKKGKFCRFSENLKQTLSDGVLLADLILTLTKCEVPGIDKSPLTTESKILNVDRCLVHLQNLGYSTSSLCTQEITSSKPKALSDLLDTLFQAQLQSTNPTMPAPRCSRSTPVAPSPGQTTNTTMKRTQKVSKPGIQVNPVITQRINSSISHAKLPNDRARTSRDSVPKVKSSGLPRPSVSTGNSSITYPSRTNGLYRRPSSVSHRSSITSLNSEATCPNSTVAPVTPGSNPKVATAQVPHMYRPLTISYARTDCTSQAVPQLSHPSSQPNLQLQSKMCRTGHSTHPSLANEVGRSVSLAPNHGHRQPGHPLANFHQANLPGGQRICSDANLGSLPLYPSAVLPHEYERAGEAETAVAIGSCNRQAGPNTQMLNKDNNNSNYKVVHGRANAVNIFLDNTNSSTYQSTTLGSTSGKQLQVPIRAQVLTNYSMALPNVIQTEPYTSRTSQYLPYGSQNNYSTVVSTRSQFSPVYTSGPQSIVHMSLPQPCPVASGTTGAEVTSTLGNTPIYYCHRVDQGHRKDQVLPSSANVTKSFTFNSTVSEQNFGFVTPIGIDEQTNYSVHHLRTNQEGMTNQPHSTSLQSPFITHSLASLNSGIPSRLPIKRQSSYEISSLSRGSSSLITSCGLGLSQSNVKQKPCSLSNSHSTASSLSAGDEKAFCDSGISSSSYSKDSACTSPSDNTVVKEEGQEPGLSSDRCADNNLDTSWCSSVSNDLNSVTRSSTDTVVHDPLHCSDLSGCTTPDSSTLKTESPASTIQSSHLLSAPIKKHQGVRAARPTTISTSGSISWLKATNPAIYQQAGEQSDEILQLQELSSPRILMNEERYPAEATSLNPTDMTSMPEAFHKNGGNTVTGSDLTNILSQSVDSRQSAEDRNQVRNWSRARSHTPECTRKYKSHVSPTDDGLHSSELFESDENVVHNTVVRKHPRGNSMTVKQNKVPAVEAKGEVGRQPYHEQRPLIAANCQEWYRKVENIEKTTDEHCQSIEGRFNGDRNLCTETICTDAEELLSKLSFVSDLNNNSSNGWDQNYFSDVESEYAALELVLPFTKAKTSEERMMQNLSHTPDIPSRLTESKNEIRCKSNPRELAEIMPFKRKAINQFILNGVDIKLPVASVAPINVTSNQLDSSQRQSPPELGPKEVRSQAQRHDLQKMLQVDAQCPPVHGARVQSKPPLNKTRSPCTDDTATVKAGSGQKSRPLDHVRLPYPTNGTNANPMKQVDANASLQLSSSLSTTSLNILSASKNVSVNEPKEDNSVNCQEAMSENKLTDLSMKVTQPQETAQEEPKILLSDRNVEDDENQSKQIKNLTAVNRLKDNEITELRQMIGQLRQEISSIKQTPSVPLTTFQTKPTRSSSCRTTHSGEQFRMEQETASIASGLSLTASDANFLLDHSPSSLGHLHLPADSESPESDCHGFSKRSRWIRTPFAKAFGKRSRSTIDAGDRGEPGKATGCTTATIFTSVGSHLAASEVVMETKGSGESQSPEQMRFLVSRLRWQMSCLLAENLRLRRLVNKNPSLLDELYQQTSNELTRLNHRHCDANNRNLRVFVQLESRSTVFEAPVDANRNNSTRTELPFPINRKAKILKIGCIEIAKNSTWQTFTTKLLQVMQDHVTLLDSQGHLFAGDCGPTPEKVLLNIPNCSTPADVNRCPTRIWRLTEDNWSEAVIFLTEDGTINGQVDAAHSPFLTIKVDTREEKVKQGETVTLKWLSFDSLLPEEKLKSYLEAIENHRTTILCGCPGTFKSKIVRKLADYLLEEFENVHTAIRIFSAKRRSTSGGDSETYDFLSQCLTNFEHKSWPKVIVVEDLHHLDDALLTTFNVMAENLTGTWPKILVTSDTDISHIEEMNIPASIKVLKHLTDVNSSAEFMERHLRRKVAQTRLFPTNEPGSLHLCEEEDALLLRIVSWVSKVWKSVNTYPCNRDLSGPSLLSLHVFMSCPIDVLSSKAWFLDIWNNLLMPFLFRQNQNQQLNSSSLSNAFDWMIVTWPWIAEIGWKPSLGMGGNIADSSSLSELHIFPLSHTSGTELNAAASQSYLSLDTQFVNGPTSNLSRPTLPENMSCAPSPKTRSRNASVTFSTGEPMPIKLQSFSSKKGIEAENILY